MTKSGNGSEFPPRTNGAREQRLLQIRNEAERAPLAHATGNGHQIQFASPEAGYYGRPILKAPAWTNEVPLYFFCGGAAGCSAIIASMAGLMGADKRLTRDARYLAAIGGAISPALLIADLGVPSRFLNMMRVFKTQSPMSVGSWTLMAFSTSSAAAAFLGSWRRWSLWGMRIKVLQGVSQFLSAVTGAVLSTYTGVLIGATAIPVWNESASILPMHFATSGMATACALLELRGHQAPALNALGIGAAMIETGVGASVEFRKNQALKPLKSGPSGWLTRIGGILSGPVPLILRLLAIGKNQKRNANLRKIAAASAVAGSITTRFAWTRAGVASSKDNRLLLQDQTEQSLQ